MNTPSRLLVGSLLAVALAFAAGCQRSQAAANKAAPLPPQIPVARVAAQTAPDALPFTGRLDALHRIELRPRVSGHVAAVHFREGDLVRAGDPLFEIDARPYRARRDQAEAAAARAAAAQALAHQERDRAQALRSAEAISTGELERRIAEAAVADALSSAARAALASAELEMSFTVVRAPADGRTGRALVTPGNLAQGDQTVLATLVSVNPMRVRFAIDERTFQRLLAMPADVSVEARVNVPGLGRPIAATLDYLGNTVDAATGTVEVRATLAATGTPLVDGMFARVELLLPATAGRVIVPETALGAEQGSRYVLVADADHKLVQRRVTLGPRFGKERAITTGVAAGEFIVTAGLQFLRPGMTIRPLEAAVSTTAATSDQ